MLLPNGYSLDSPDIRILFVEDEEDSLHLYKSMLTRAGIPAAYVRTPQEALDAIESRCKVNKPFDLVVTDLVFVGQNMAGPELTRRVRTCGHKGRIVFFTGRDEPMVEMSSQFLDVAEVWHKPADVPRLVEKLTKMLPNLPRMKQSAGAEPPPPQENLKERLEWKIRFPAVMWVILCLLIVSVSINCFTLYRSTYTVGAMRDIQRYVVAKNGTIIEPGQYRVFVPQAKSSLKTLSDGSVRVTFQFEPKDAAAAQSLADQRGSALWLNVTRGK